MTTRTRPRITRRGWTLAIGAVLLAAVGRVLGLPQLWIVATSLVVLLLGAWLWVAWHDDAIVAERLVPEHLQVGSVGRVDLSVHNNSDRSSATVRFADQFDGGERFARFTLSPLRADTAARAAYRIPTQRRGRFHLGPLHASITDPFAVARRGWTAASRQEIIIHPRIIELHALPELRGSGIDSDSRDVAGRRDHDGEFHTLRDYAPSDDLRHVHWKSTARRGRLMVRQDESRRRAPVTVLLDVRALAHDEASFERAVEATASIVNTLSRQDAPFEVITSSGVALGQAGRRYGSSVLDELAVIECRGANQFVPATSGTKFAALIAVVGALQPFDATALDIMVRATGALVVVQCHESGPITAPRMTVDYSGPDTQLAESWDRAVLTWQLNATHRYSPAPLSR